MAAPLPSTPREQAKVLRRLADDLEQSSSPLPLALFAPIVDMVEHRSQGADVDATEATKGSAPDLGRPEVKRTIASPGEATDFAQWVQSLPIAPVVPLDSFDRSELYP